MKNKLVDISNETGVPLKKVYDFLYILKDGHPIENNKLLRMIGVSRNALNQIKEMLSGFFEKPSQNTQLLAQKSEGVNALFDSAYSIEESLLSFLTKEDLKRRTKEFEKYANLRLSPDRSYDQFTATSETVARRASLMNFLKDIDDKSIAFMGDDDFTSIATALLGRPQKITVFEIDKRIVKLIREISSKKNLNIEVVEYDARKRLPKQFTDSYDIVFTDPPYTTDGVSLFMSRGVDLLDKESNASRIYLCYGNSDRARERILSVQKLLSDSGLMIRYVFDKFNRYVGAESIGSASSLYIADVTPMMRPTIQGEFNEKIYTI